MTKNYPTKILILQTKVAPTEVAREIHQYMLTAICEIKALLLTGK